MLVRSGLLKGGTGGELRGDGGSHQDLKPVYKFRTGISASLHPRKRGHSSAGTAGWMGGSKECKAGSAGSSAIHHSACRGFPWRQFGEAGSGGHRGEFPAPSTPPPPPRSTTLHRRSVAGGHGRGGGGEAHGICRPISMDRVVRRQE